MGDKCHAKNFGCDITHLVDGLGHLDATALAPTASVNLRFNDPNLAAKRLRCLDRLIDGETGNAAWCRNAVFAQDFLALIFVNIHGF